tara:strand:- start:629 stop:748 length:120 start_codon:yes stop_codon:yes gene_type:complete
LDVNFSQEPEKGKKLNGLFFVNILNKMTLLGMPTSVKVG